MSIVSARRRAAAAGLAVVAAVGLGVATSAPAGAKIIPGRCGYTDSQPLLVLGSRGTAVKQAQCELNYSLRQTTLVVDGAFGSKTLAAVKQFQGCVGLVKDGKIGPKTWASLNVWAASPDYVC